MPLIDLTEAELDTLVHHLQALGNSIPLALVDLPSRLSAVIHRRPNPGQGGAYQRSVEDEPESYEVSGYLVQCISILIAILL